MAGRVPRPTRQGWLGLAAAVTAAVCGRVFGVLELYVIAAGIAGAVAIGWLAVAARGPDLVVDRWIHPPIVTTGDDGRVDLAITNPRGHRSPRVELVEPVGTRDTARITVAPVPPRQRVDAAYRIPTARRGVLTIGPLVLERRDLLGVVVARRVAAGTAEVVVAPRTHELSMPELGHGVLGRHLLAQARRIGAGEFHSLRDYAVGDEPRMIHWRASARSEELKVRQHATEGVRRCIVVLDRAPVHDGTVDGGGTGDHGADGEGFERAVVAAASLVESAQGVGLTTRFVTTGGIDLRGPDVAATTLRLLARLEPEGARGPDEDVDHVERDPGDGLGLVVVVTGSPDSPAWRRSEALVDPTLARVGVFTRGGPERGRLGVDASSIEAFLAGWEDLAGRSARRRPVERAGVPA